MGKKKEVEKGKYFITIQLPEDVAFFCDDHPIEVVAKKVASGDSVRVYQPQITGIDEPVGREFHNIIFMNDVVLYVKEDG